MLPEERNIVSPEEFDEFFQKENRALDIKSPEEEVKSRDRHGRFTEIIRQQTYRKFYATEHPESFIDEEWVSDNTQRLEIGIPQFTVPFLSMLRELLTDEYKDYRVLISVYADRKESKSYIGSMTLCIDRILIEKKLNFLLQCSDIKRQFAIRYYLWATSEWQREIEESFPRLRLFKNGSAEHLLRFMGKLSQFEQHTLARGLLKRFHPEATAAVGETLLPGELALRSELDDFCRNESAKEIFGMASGSGKVKSAGKRKLRETTAAKFQAAFGEKCVGLPVCPDQDSEFRFKMKVSGWVVSTNFWFGRRNNLINYSHGISSEATFECRENNNPIASIGSFISFHSWLGIRSQTEWEYITNQEVESVCDSVIEYCRHFFDVAPKLLKGLDPETWKGV